MRTSCRSARWAYLSAGWLGTGLGVVGAFLPVVPTTPFLLIALWGFGRSSPALERWLISHPRFGRTLREWQEYGAIATWIKVVALAGLASSIPAVFALTESLVGRGLHLMLIMATAVFILSRPSRPTAYSQ
ncbi:YbaN family protein [Lentisalinibacter salinarum]|uniref:YbaN family protein n=1 Tax=Lentisalinibacter salinarum TaxID=2992239 RepID=UPI0038645BD0